MDTDTAWELWGLRDPYFSVLTDSKYRAAVMTAQAKEEFLASGRAHVDHLMAVSRRLAGASFMPRRALDFGCGVGRIVVPLAALADEVVGLDIAPSMLAEARRNCLDNGVGNAVLALSDDTLSAAAGPFDLIHSSIVLQHIPLERGRRIFEGLVSRLAPGGVGAIHVMFGLTLHASSFGRPLPPPPAPPPGALTRWKRQLRRWAGTPPPAAPLPSLPAGDPEMQMNSYDLNELMFILQRSGVGQVFSEFTDHGGALGVTLYFTAPASAATS